MIEKIDIIGQIIYKYDNRFQLVGQLMVTSEYDSFINTFSNNQDLLTVNITQPIKRVMRFYKIDMGIPESFDELDYSVMNQNQQNSVDEFIELIKNS